MTLDDLKAKVVNLGTVEEGIVAVLQDISQQLKDAKAAGDLAKVQEIADIVDQQAKNLADAIVANTPSEVKA